MMVKGARPFKMRTTTMDDSQLLRSRYQLQHAVNFVAILQFQLRGSCIIRNSISV
jgi:hypothetical protein